MKTPLVAYLEPPLDFQSEVEVAASYLEIEGKILLLQLSSKKTESGKWGVPAGKIESGETKEKGVERELFEETGLLLKSTAFTLLGTLYMRKPALSYTYHIFEVFLEEIPDITLSDEHIDYLFADITKLNEIPLMTGAFEALRFYLSNRSKK